MKERNCPFHLLKCVRTSNDQTPEAGEFRDMLLASHEIFANLGTRRHVLFARHQMLANLRQRRHILVSQS